ncbi:MAG: GNAT family N-acetyltransferase [Actinobacteria bacterium]|nr:GNAT family N-acetyltransferase [Actinomycetota bacterium]
MNEIGVKLAVNLNFTIKDLTYDKLEKLNIKCSTCQFWVDNGRTSFLSDFSGIDTLWGFLKSKYFMLKNLKNRKKFTLFFNNGGGIIKAAFSGKKCIGVLFAGRYYLFPRLKLFNVYPPDSDSIFLGCIYVMPECRNLGVGKKLLMSIEKDLIKDKISSIESIGKRFDDDMDLEEYINSPIIPVKFLIKNGFYIRKNDNLFPLLRLDLDSIRKVFLEGKLFLKNLMLERGARTPVAIKKISSDK